MKREYIVIALALSIFLLSCESGVKKPEYQEVVEASPANLPEPENSSEQASYKVELIDDLPNHILALIPEGYGVFDTIFGNLNLDNLTDLILILDKNREKTTTDVDDEMEQRPLLILVGEADGTYKLVKRNDNTVYCKGCGGIFGDPYSGVTIKNGYFSVEHYAGSAWRWTRIPTFKYSKAENDWFLYKDGGESFHTSAPEKAESKVLTVKDFGKIRFEEFDINREERK